MFRNTVRGDEVWSFTHGVGWVKETPSPHSTSILVEFEAGFRRRFRVDGRRVPDAQYPDLYWRAFTPPEKAYIRETKPKYQWLYQNLSGNFEMTRSTYANEAEVRRALFHGEKIICRITETEINKK